MQVPGVEYPLTEVVSAGVPNDETEGLSETDEAAVVRADRRGGAICLVPAVSTPSDPFEAEGIAGEGCSSISASKMPGFNQLIGPVCCGLVISGPLMREWVDILT